MSVLSFKFNGIFEPVFTTKHRIIDIWGGRARGGSHFVTDYFLFKLTQPSYFRGYFVRETFNDIKDSLFQDIKDRMDANLTINKAEFKINENNYSITHIPSGNKIISKGVSGSGKRTAKMKSLAGATHIAVEEADELGEDSFRQMNLSLRTVEVDNVQVFRIFNPPQKTHWIWKDYNLTESSVDGYYIADPKSDSDILSIHSTYLDNLLNVQSSTVRAFEDFKENDPEYYYTVVMGLISEGVRGRIYSEWSIIQDEAFNKLDLPKAYVLDFGYSQDPNAIIEVKWDKNYRYVKELLYETGLDNLELARRMRDLGITQNDLIIADAGGGGDLRIAELRRGWRDESLSFNVKPTIKGQGSILAGIGMLQSCKLFMTEGSKNGWYEYQEYKWGMNANKELTKQPIDKYNHIMDCIRYFELSKRQYL